MGRAFGRILVAAVWGVVACGSEPGPSQGTGGVGAAAGAAGAGAVGVSGATHAGTNAASGSSGTGGMADGGAGRDGQAGDDQGTPTGHCDSSQPFGVPQPISELNTAAHQAGPRLSTDELRILYLCHEGTTTRLCLARRTSKTAKFDEPRVVLERNAGVGWLSDDDMLLFYENDDGQEVLASSAIGNGFPAGAPILPGYGDPYVVGGENGNLYLSKGSRLVVAKLAAWLPQADEPVLGVDSFASNVRPVLTPDELTLYSGSPAGVGLRLDIWMQERHSTSEAFGERVNVAAVNTTDDEFPGFISADGCRLYFDGGKFPRDLFVSERRH